MPTAPSATAVSDRVAHLGRVGHSSRAGWEWMGQRPHLFTLIVFDWSRRPFRVFIALSASFAVT